MMKLLIYIYVISFLPCSCSDKKEHCYPIVNPMEEMLDNEEVEKLFIEDMKIIQMDNQNIVQFSDPILLDGLIMVNSYKDGVLLYDMEGQYVRKIGCVGDGPEEYNKARSVTWDPERNLIYVLSKPDILLSYTVGGKCLKRIKLNLPDNFMVKSCVYFHDFLYIINYIGLAENKWTEHVL